MNLGIFGGRLGKDAELNRRATGEPVLNFSLAVDIGTRQEPKTMWIECALWGKRGEALQQYLTKGSKVTVSGRISLDEYTSKQDGSKRTAMRVTVNEIDLHSGRDQAAQPRQAAPAGAPADDDIDDHIPF
jgi:single-strand DNA-binding protein